MSRAINKDFTCPECGYVIKAPYTEADIRKHVEEKHANDPSLLQRWFARARLR